jgi:hypothetical protein
MKTSLALSAVCFWGGTCFDRPQLRYDHSILQKHQERCSNEVGGEPLRCTKILYQRYETAFDDIAFAQRFRSEVKR